MAQHNRPYQAISCEYHDMLEILAMRRKVVGVLYVNAQDERQARVSTISDVFTQGGEEYLVMGTGEAVRLDRLVAVDNRPLPAICPVASP
jgi:Rho-binding antiterminator